VWDTTIKFVDDLIHKDLRQFSFQITVKTTTFAMSTYISIHEILVYTTHRWLGNKILIFYLYSLKNIIIQSDRKKFSKKVDLIIWKTKNSITFTSIIQIEWIEALHSNKNIIYKKKHLNVHFNFLRFFCCIVSTVLKLS